MAKYALKFPALSRYDFFEHYFFIQRMPDPGSPVFLFAEVVEQEIFDYAELKQVHSGIVYHLSRNPELLLKGDGIISDTPGFWFGVHVADCAPVYFIDEANRAAAVVHCGWRPISENMLENTIALMVKDFSSKQENLYAFIGPTIQADDYEIGPEITHHFNTDSVKNIDGQLYLDIPLEIKLRLIKLGLNPEKIDKFPVSTYKEPAFCSYRREGDDVKRMTALIKIKEK